MNKELLSNISLSVPEFSYSNGIAYEVTVKTSNITLSLVKNDALNIKVSNDMDLDTEFINEAMIILEERLYAEIEKNKIHWYNLKYYYGE